MVRVDKYNILHRSGRLANQQHTDNHGTTESERLGYFRFNQSKLGSERYIHLRDALRENEDVPGVRQIVILPSSFTRSPRYMHERTQDALTYVKYFPTPDLFITLTCNPSWPEILNNLLPGDKYVDRPDIVARVFRLKLKKLMVLVNKGETFGACRRRMYTIEWQKRGLPHAHILLWLKDRICLADIDKIICAGIPYKDQDPELFQIVSRHIIHGPCGLQNPTSPRMKNNCCEKRFPKQFTNKTHTR